MNGLPLKQQLEKLLDENTSSGEVSVIVQTDSNPSQHQKLIDTAAKAMQQQRLAISPRDMLPRALSKRAVAAATEAASARPKSASKAVKEMLSLTQIQRVGKAPMNELLKEGLIREIVAHMIQPAKKSEPDRPAPKPFWASNAMPLRLDRDRLEKLIEVPNIRAVHLNRTLRVPTHMQVDALGEESEDIFTSTWGLQKTNALGAWGLFENRGEGVKIGLLDTGIDAEHPELKGKVANWAEFDSMGQLSPNTSPRDSHEHGTHCGGTIVGGNAGGRHIGMAPEATLAAALVLDGDNGGSDAQILAGIDWCLEQKVDLISMSLGGLSLDAETPSTYTEAMITCMQAGVPVVAAIGNEGSQTTGAPGSDFFALSVGATDYRDRPAGFSGGRTQVILKSQFISPRFLPMPYSKPELSAPGVAVYSSVPGGKYKSFNGTSMAAPHVAGAIALLLSATNIRERVHGSERWDLIRNFIVGSVEDLGESGQDHRYGFGRLDVLRAIEFARQRGYAG